MLLKAQTVSCLLNCVKCKVVALPWSVWELVILLSLHFTFFKASKPWGFCFVLFYLLLFVLNCTSVIGNSVQQHSVKWTFLSYYLKEVISWLSSVVYTLPPGSAFNFGYSMWFKNIHLLLICVHSIEIPCTTEYLTYVYRTVVCILTTSRLVSTVCSYSSLIFVLNLSLCAPLLVIFWPVES